MFLARQVSLSLEIYLLHLLPLVELEALSQLSNRHLFHQAMTTSFSWVESLGSLNRDLFKLTDLPDKLLLLSQFGCFFILTLFESLLQVTMHLIPD